MPAKPPKNTYLRGDTYWGRLKVAGTEYRGSLRTTDSREAARRLKAWRLKLERAALGNPDALTFKAAVVRWAREVLPGAVKPAVAKRYLSSVSQLTETFGDKRVDQITTSTVGDYIGSRAGKVTNATIRRDLTALSRLMSACVAWGALSENPVRLYDRSIIREKREPILPPSPRAVATIIAAAPVGMARVLRLLDQTGMRANEAVTLAREELDAGRQQINLTRTKTSRPRSLPYVSPAGDAGPVLAEGMSKGVLFRTEGGKPYANFSANFGQVMRRVVAEERTAGREFRRFRVHDLRHAFAVRWLKQGGDIYGLSRHLGHTSVKTTEGYLNFLTTDEARIAMGVAQTGAQTPRFEGVEPGPEIG